MTEPGVNVTELLARWRGGEPAVVDELLPLVYDQLRRLARGFLRKERDDHTLQPTALIHEAYLRMVDQGMPRLRDRLHFYALAGRVMRQVLVDHARTHSATKRGGDAVRVTLEDATRQIDPRAHDILILDDAIERLSLLDPRQARIVELRFFGGLTIDECAEVLEVSSPTVINDTRKARAWLFQEIAARQAVSAQEPS